MKNDLTTTQVAEYLGCHRDTAKRLVPQIPGAYKWGNPPRKNSPWRVPIRNLVDFIARRKYAVGSQKLAELEAVNYAL